MDMDAFLYFVIEMVHSCWILCINRRVWLFLAGYHVYSGYYLRGYWLQ